MKQKALEKIKVQESTTEVHENIKKLGREHHISFVLRPDLKDELLGFGLKSLHCRSCEKILLLKVNLSESETPFCLQEVRSSRTIL